MLDLYFISKHPIVSDFIVSARKYRPSTFSSVVGQNVITSTLSNAIKDNQLAHSFLFCGPRGVGKTTCARILAKSINCNNLSSDVISCDKCDSCISFNQSNSFNIHELDAASNNSVDDIRNLIDQVRFAPQVGRYNVYIIDEAHMLSSSAFNAFLKTLEEPPAHAIFILATTEKNKIIPTILSRCQIFHFKSISVIDIVTHLEYIAKSEEILAEKQALHLIAQKSEGSLRDALSLFDKLISSSNSLTHESVIKNLNILDYEYYLNITEKILKNNIKDVLLIFDEILQNGFDGHEFLNGLSNHLRDLLVCKNIETLVLLEKDDNVKNLYIEQSSKFDISFLVQSLNVCNDCDIQYRNSKNQRLLVELSLMKILLLLHKKLEKKTELTSKNDDEEKTKEYLNSESFLEKGKELLIVKEDSVVHFENKKKINPTKISISKAMEISEKGKGNELKNEKADRQESSYQKFDDVWIKFAELKKKEGRTNLFITMTESSPSIQGEGIVEMQISNDAQQKLINQYKSQIIEFLNSHLDNHFVDITAVLNEEKTDEVPYTSKDKLQQIVHRNSSLIKLKDELGLDPDY